jgi:hypothetical protein
MNTRIFLILMIFVSALTSFNALATKVEVKDNGSTDGTEVASSSDENGEAKARKFFRKPAAAQKAVSKSSADGDHYLALHLGTFFNTDSYQWGQNPHTTNTGKIMAGLSYRMGTLGALADWLIRADFMSYSLPESTALQLGLIPMITIPDSSSQFPLYFGVGAGPGIFFTQVPGESSLSFDYQLVGGVRLFSVFDQTGFFLESGLKNHILLLTDGQFNGFFLATGAIFSF